MAKVFDISGRGPSNRRLLIAGVLMIVASAPLSPPRWCSSCGRLENTRVTAAMKNAGDGRPVLPDVRYHGLLVGSDHHGDARRIFGKPNFVDIDLQGGVRQRHPADRDRARGAGATFSRCPASNSVDNGDAPGHPGWRDVIKEDTNLPTVLFQTTISKLRDIPTPPAATATTALWHPGRRQRRYA